MTQTAPEPDPGAILRAAFWMLGAIAAFSLMAVAGRAASAELDTFEIMTYRSIVGLFVVVGAAIVTQTLHQISTRNMRLQLARNVSHFIGQNLWFFGLTMIPLAQLFALEFTTPLWVLVLSPLLLGEKLTQTRVLAATLGFIGILIVARPSPDTVNIGTLAAAGCAIAFAFSITYTKLLTRSEHLVCILFWMTAIQIVFGLVCAGYDGDMTWPSATIIPWVVLIGLCGLGAHFCLTMALTIAPATVVIPIDFARLPVIAIVGVLLYNEPIDLLVILGAGVIFTGNYLNIWFETRKSKA